MGMAADTNARIVERSPKTADLSRPGGMHGAAPGDFDSPHALAMDSKGRLYVGDRTNSRIQIFNQNGKLLAVWKQFGRPSGLYDRQAQPPFMWPIRSRPLCRLTRDSRIGVSALAA